MRKAEATSSTKRGGVSVTSLELFFTARAPAEQWRQLVRSLGCRLRPSATSPEDPPRWSTEIVALPSVIEPSSHYLSGWVHSLADQPDETHWHLNLGAVPGPNPPSVVVELSNQVGGYPEVLARIVQSWPAERRMEVETRVTYVLEAGRWASPFAPKRRKALPSPSAAEQRAVLSREVYTWKIEPGGALEEVMDLGLILDGHFALQCSGREDLEMATDMFSRVEEATWGRLKAFLKEKTRVRRKR